jgi:acetyl-CoA/propionyl-CoA carboxylase biotin carboxyl carrier protein
MEKFIERPRHIEFQVLADEHGNVMSLGERECSIQRRHQKLIEEAPSLQVSPKLRAELGKTIERSLKEIGYWNAGTIEFLMDEDGKIYFIEMNTRVQVEHCVTEMVTGIDIVKTGIRVAAGEVLPYTQDDVVLRGHAIECRINAEDASKNFAPAPGHISAYKEPTGPGVRVDSGIGANSDITPMYDPMVAKLIVWDSDREQATARMLRALGEYEIGELKTLIPFHKAILATPQWANAETCHDLIEDREWLKSTGPAALDTKLAEPVAEDDAEKAEQAYTVEVSGKRFDVRVIGPAFSGGVVVAAPGNGGARTASAGPAKRAPRASGGGGGGGDTLASPLQGTIFKVNVEAGATVAEGDLICVIEAMKMENEITAHKAGVIAELPISPGASVASGDTLAVITAAG